MAEPSAVVGLCYESNINRDPFRSGAALNNRA